MPSVATRVTPEEYLERERKAETKSEYRNGEIVAMAGASFAHTVITTNVAGELRQLLKGTYCTVHTTDLRLAVSAAGLYTYPDVTVVCGKPVLVTDQFDTLSYPVLVVDVLSKSTQDYDLGQKYASYRAIPSLIDYVTVAQDRVHIQQHTRQPDHNWLRREFTELGAAIILESLGIELSVAEVYSNVDFV
jgi:Uma2 family endonuclease